MYYVEEQLQLLLRPGDVCFSGTGNHCNYSPPYLMFFSPLYGASFEMVS